MKSLRRLALAAAVCLWQPVPLTAQQNDLMPEPVQAKIREMAAECGAPKEMLSKPGFFQLADLNSDFRLEVLLDASVLGCRFYCGARNCLVWLFASDAAGGYRVNEFLSPGAYPTMFACAADGTCRFADAAARADAGVTVPVDVTALPTAQSGGYETLQGLLLNFDNWDKSINNIGPNFYLQVGNWSQTPMMDIRWYLYDRTGGGHVPIADNVAEPFFLDPSGHRQIRLPGRYREAVTLCAEYRPQGGDVRLVEAIAFRGAEDVNSPPGKWYVYRKERPTKARIAATDTPCRALFGG